MNFTYPIIISEAVITPDNRHRYSLTRIWDKDKPMIMFIGLNPSRANAIKNDPTITRCINYAQRWRYEETTFEELMQNGEGYKGYGGMCFANIYSFRTPYVKGPMHPKDIEEGWRPLIENLDVAYNGATDGYLRHMINESKTVVCCWGAWNFISDRVMQVLEMIPEPYCFGTNADGSPKHPLYLPKTATLERWEIKKGLSCNGVETPV